MKIGTILQTNEITERITETFFIDADTGHLCVNTSVNTPINIESFLALLEDFKDIKEADGFERELRHTGVSGDCLGELDVFAIEPDQIIYLCKKCNLYVSWSWEEFCRYYDCR